MIKASERLKQERLKKKLSLEDISKSTKIKATYLELIEDGKYQDLPSASYAAGFVKNYAKVLGFKDEEIMALFRREFDGEKAYRVLPKGFEQKEDYVTSKFKNKRFIFLISLIFLLFIGYILFQYRYAFINPPLEIKSPTENAIIYSSSVKVTGKTDVNSTVYVNKELVSVDQDGNFEKNITVFPGKTVVDIVTISKFLKQTEKKIDINVKGGS